MINNRDNFSKSTKETLSKRVGTLCSNPNCCAPTYAARSETDKSIGVGVAAHIEGAAPNSARYNKNQTDEQRRSIENGIWLCQDHAKMIDNDPTKYTVSLLKQWKELAEKRAAAALESPKLISYSFADPQSLLLVTRQSSIVLPQPTNLAGNLLNPIRFRPIRAPHDQVDVNVPLNLNLHGHDLASGHFLFQILYQNTGVQIDSKIMIKLSFKSSIADISLDQERRMYVIEGGGQNASFVSFYIPEALPNERQHATLVVTRDEFPEIEFWTAHTHVSDEVYMYDVIFT